ncbi:MAG TPA: amidohydrolase family protein [Vicinamibacterales bacterium]|nr:amidohydrolase family protein [Vicinamibacterales bacterium]
MTGGLMSSGGLKTARYVLVLLAALAWPASAQNLMIVNARIVDGKGGVIERGSVLVRDGKIVSVTAGAPTAVAAQRIDAQGRTLMPGFIDAHRHIVQGDAKQWLAKTGPAQLQEFLDAGFTTVLCAICPDETIELRQRIDAGTVKGPRLLLGTIIPVARAPVPGGGRGDPARFDTSRPPLRPTTAAAAVPDADILKAVESAAARKFDYIKTVITTTPGGPETRTLKLIVDEGKKRNIPTITHAVSVIDTLAAVEAMPAVLVHTPHIGRLEEDAAAAKRIAGAGIPMTSTLQVFAPHFGAGNAPLFRDGQPFPWNTISSAGQGPVNARLLWEAGISYGYGTDTTWPPRQSLADELRALSLVFSPLDITKIMGQGAARSTLKQDLIGTLDVGKQADLVLIDGNPLTNATDLLKVVTTIKGGRIVSDRRAAGRR